MRHEFAISGYGFSLRPVAQHDAQAIARLRAPSERTRFIHSSPSDERDQSIWLERYFDRAGDWYFAICRDGHVEPEGFVGVYNLSEAAGWRVAEWGRWVLRTGSLAAAASALLVYRIAFEQLGIHELFCHTVAANGSVVSFHDRYAAKSRRPIANAFTLGGLVHDAIEHRLTRSDLAQVEECLGPLAARIAARREGP